MATQTAGLPKVPDAPHPASWSQEETAAVAAFRAGLSAESGVAVYVKAIRHMAEQFPVAPVPDNVTLTPTTFARFKVPGWEEEPEGEVHGEWLEPKGSEGDEQLPVLIYVHGGGYVMMSPKSHRMITGAIAARGIRVLSIDYRLAPENPHPAAVCDALSAWRHLRCSDVPAEKICIAGDSAGGGLAHAAAVYLREHPEFGGQVAGIVAISPWLDLSGSSPTSYLGDEFDADILPKTLGDQTDSMAVSYAGSKEIYSKKLDDPTFAPIADPIGKALPPTLACLATADRLLGKDLAFYVPRMATGAPVEVDIYLDQFHVGDFRGFGFVRPSSQAVLSVQVFQLLPFLVQTQVCLDRIADFLRRAVSDPKAVMPEAESIDYEGKAREHSGPVEELKRMLKSYIERAEKVGWKGPIKDVYLAAGK
ncbi:Alpha/Beta hydrolase protein [Hyaloraphidium curvatum]|nr:Alpha/Beta hydrolase protein [Hyaloraphidium curvatum]